MDVNFKIIIRFIIKQISDHLILNIRTLPLYNHKTVLRTYVNANNHNNMINCIYRRIKQQILHLQYCI